MYNFQYYVDKQIPFKELGRDWNGVDCWGLVCLFYKREMKVSLDSHTDAYETTEDFTIADRINRETKAIWMKVDKPEDGDVVLVRMKGRPMHVGVYKHPQKMLHIEVGNTPTIEKLDSLKWKRRVLGFYRLKN